ncbi:MULTISPECIES: F0F1 ATP synthase subunit B [unclassified Paenibacillus]|jgi:F-type H+-transporting ATPase subunit b|uniref:F0F1 ATP synthase subunit B n=1 Tax=unclassified Paenibacillus TaxID=185978 RepID=UPI002787042A|nr:MULTISPECIES: F0F1 ATP synthase subunit B [unclassified Paenibacillus]MDQ0903000.1 F-type H+-transporting ATPase subunit b [Paenibacillus sp. V4I7]MDQ0918524.1 F-type H+-transporting ATPase subunit b [Paenibacillus sp. V4I5]
MGWHWESFVFAIIAFLILYLLLNKYAFGPLVDIMEKRRQLIAEQVGSADKNRQEAEKLVTEQKEAFQEARKEAYDLIEEARNTSNKQAETIITQAKEEASRLKEDALRAIDIEKNKAVAELRSEVGALSVKIASKIVEKEVDAAAQQGIVDQYLKKVGDNA